MSLKRKRGEADVIINAERLSEAQVMTIRVAVTDLYQRMGQPDALGGDDLGIKLALAYKARAEEVLRLMLAMEAKP